MPRSKEAVQFFEKEATTWIFAQEIVYPSELLQNDLPECFSSRAARSCLTFKRAPLSVVQSTRLLIPFSKILLVPVGQKEPPD